MLVKTTWENEPLVKMAAASSSSVGRVLTPYLIGRSFVCDCCLLSFSWAAWESGSFFWVTIFILHAFHGRAHSNVSPSPCLFQAGHTELFWPFLTCQSFKQLGGLPLLLCQSAVTLLILWSPKLGTELQTWSHLCQAERKGHFPGSASYILLKQPRKPWDGLFCHKATPLAHGQLAVHQEPPGCLDSQPQPGCLQVLPGAGLTFTHRVTVSPFSLSVACLILCSSCSSQLHKAWEGALLI